MGFTSLRQALLVVLAAAHGTSAATDFDALLAPLVSNGTEIANAGDADFSSVLAPRWSTWRAPTFQGAVMPRTEADVVAIVKYAKKNGLSFLANNHGHGTNIHYGEKPLDLNINLAHFNTVSIDAANYRMTVGGGVRHENIIPKLYEAGREMPTGNAVCVGVLGLAVGGGVGTQMGLHGLVLDSLESVRIVTGTGDAVTASKTQNSDLFWAIRGAGANFGIITSATFKIYPQTNNGNVVFNSYSFPASANASIFELLKSYDDNLPPPLSLIPAISFNRTSNQPVMALRAVYYGTQEEAQPHLDKIAALGPISVSPYYGPQPGMFDLLSRGVCASNTFSSFTVGTKRTDPATWESVFAEMSDFYKSHPGYFGSILIQRSSTAVTTKVPDCETAYPGREIGTYVLHINAFNPKTTSEADIKAMGDSVRAKLWATSGFGPEKRAYLNYAYGDEGLATLYGGANLPRLRKLKARWDPQGMFGRGNPIV